MDTVTFKNLKPGDIVKNTLSGNRYMVHANYGDRVTAVLTADLTNPPEWDLAYSPHGTTPVKEGSHMARQDNSFVSLEVGKTYLSRNKTPFKIIHELSKDDGGYHKGFRYRGISIPPDPDADFVTTHTCNFKVDGTQFSDSGVMKSTPFDLMEIIQ